MTDPFEKVGVKESLELLEGVKLIAGTVGLVIEDGKVNVADLPKLLPLVQNASVLIAAINGIKGIKEEAKDLDQAELLLLGAKVWEIFKAVKA